MPESEDVHGRLSRYEWRPAVRHVFVLFALLVLMVPACSGSSACLTNGSYQFYETNYDTFANACSIGDKLFWGFALNNKTGNEPAATGINVQPVPGDGFSNPGISFNAGGWTADVGFPIDAIISYDVATASGSPVIEDTTLTITGTLTGAGSAGQVTETLTPSVPGSPLTVFLPGPPVSAHIDFLSDEQAVFAVQNEIILSITSKSSTSHVSVVENQFSENIPEPAVTFLIGSGLMLFGLVRRRRSCQE
jgi:hypothetical protein